MIVDTDGMGFVHPYVFEENVESNLSAAFGNFESTRRKIVGSVVLHLSHFMELSYRKNLLYEISPGNFELYGAKVLVTTKSEAINKIVLGAREEVVGAVV